MKKLSLIAIALMAVLISSCKQDNSCIKEMVTVIQDGWTQNQNAEQLAAESDEYVSTQPFILPDGDVFLNASVVKIINDHPNYKLTPEDKAMLIQTVSAFGLPKIRKTGTWSPELAKIYQAEDRMRRANVDYDIEKIKKAERLKDLINL